MSHFNALVILPVNDERSLSDTLEIMLDPYSEHLQLDPYETECMCVGFKARLDVNKKLETEKKYDEVRNEFKTLPEEQQINKRWMNLLKPVEEYHQKLLEEHPLYNKPMDDCKICNGTGIRVSSYNPLSKWDWWVIGGRWDGWIFGPEFQEKCRDEFGFNFGEEHHKPENNMRPVKEIKINDELDTPFAIITPEGEWIEKGKMMYFAYVKDEKYDDEWFETVKSILNKYSENNAVTIDCHI